MAPYQFIFLFVACCWLPCKADWLHDLQDGKTVTIGNGVQLRVDPIAGDGDSDDGRNRTFSDFGSHILRVFLGEVGLSFAKGKERDGVQVGLFTSSGNSSVQARGEANVFHVFLPLLIGFKIAGSILTTLVAVIIVSLKAFLASKLALLLSGAIALKKLLSNHHPPEVHYPVEFAAPPHHPYEAYDYPSASGYHAPMSHLHSAPDSYEPSSHEAAESNVSAQYAPASNASRTPSLTTPGIKRRVFKRKNPVIPVFTLQKITRHQTE